MPHITKDKCNNKIGCENELGRVIVESKYDSRINTYESGSRRKAEYYIVSISDKYGAINENGDVVIPIECQGLVYLFDGLFAIRKNSDNGDYTIGIMNTNSEIIVPFEYKCIKADNPYIVCYKYGYASGYKDSSLFHELGRWHKYKDVVVFPDNARGACDAFPLIENENKIALVRKDGEVILSGKYDDIIPLFGDYFAAKINIDNENWHFGVIDSNDNCVVDFSHRYIEGFEIGIFHCFDIETNNKLYKSDFIKHRDDFEYKNIKLCSEKWINLDKNIIHDGCGKILESGLLAINQYSKWGVVNSVGKRIANLNYDKIASIGDYLIIQKDSYIGVLSIEGHLLIDPIYLKIECVNIEDLPCDRIDSSQDSVKKYYSYSKKYIFDTNGSCFYANGKVNDLLIRCELKSPINKENIVEPNRFDFSKYFILTTKSYSEIFSLEDGIIHNSRYDYITQITNTSFVVKKNGLYGVFLVDKKIELIPCKYDRIQFEGDCTALLCKDGKWGAKLVVLASPILDSLRKVDIPVEYLEVKILDDIASVYGVKRQYENWDGEVKTEYILLSRSGNRFGKTDNFEIRFESQFTMYNNDKILTSYNGKYGFISWEGYVSIPFKYDEIIECEDGNFDVRIDNRWGVLTLDGFEKIAVKYLGRIKSLYVRDAASGMAGKLNCDGVEQIPTLYEYLEELGNFYCFSQEGRYSDEPNYFNGIAYAKWGCINKQAQVIIQPQYCHFEREKNCILAGRDGRWLYCGQGFYKEKYGGIWDLLNFDGEIIIGGFSQIHYSDCGKYLFLYFGGNWKTECCEYGFYSYYFVRENGGWLILDQELNSLVFDDTGNPYQFEKGKIINLTEVRDGNNKLKSIARNIPVPLINIPDEDVMPIIKDGYIYEANDYSKYIRRISDNAISEEYDNLELINNGVFFVEKDSKVGIITVDNILLNVNYFAITVPIHGYVFATYQKEDDKFNIELLNIEDVKFEKIAIFTDIERDEVDNLYYYSKLRLAQVVNDEGVTNFAIKDKHIADICKTAFSEIQEFSRLNSVEINAKGDYWFSAFDLSPSRSKYKDYSYDDDNDYKLDTWDAMTDGMYGDYPGGDVDYDILGF